MTAGFSGPCARSASRTAISSADATTTTRSRSPARASTSWLSAAHSTNHGTSTTTLPNTTNRGSSASPAKSCTPEMASAATPVREHTRRRVRHGASGAAPGSPTLYAARHEQQDVAQGPGEPARTRPRVLVHDARGPCTGRRRPATTPGYIAMRAQRFTLFVIGAPRPSAGEPRIVEPDSTTLSGQEPAVAGHRDLHVGPDEGDQLGVAPLERSEAIWRGAVAARR